MRAGFLLLLGVAAVAAVPTKNGERIVGGELTTIDRYPFGVAMLSSLAGLWYDQACGGTLINNRSVLTAAHCFILYRLEFQWRSRVGSSFASTGGSVFATQQIIRHPNFHTLRLDNDFAIIRVSGTIPIGGNVQPAPIAGPAYNPGDGQEVWTIGWGFTCFVDCTRSEQLRHVQTLTVNQEVCRTRYQELRYEVTDSMICTGWLDVGGKDRCHGDTGGPVIHQGVVFGVSSWGQECGHPHFPAVNARVSAASDWIVANA